MSQQLDIHVCTLYRWVSEYGKYGEDAFPGNGKPNFILIEEIKRLKKEKLALMNELERSLIFQEQVSSFLKKAKFIWY